MSSKNTNTKVATKKQSADQSIVAVKNANTIVENKLENTVVEKTTKKTKSTATQEKTSKIELAPVVDEKIATNTTVLAVTPTKTKNATAATAATVVEPVKVLEQIPVVNNVETTKKTKKANAVNSSDKIQESVNQITVEVAQDDEDIEAGENSKLRYFKLIYNNNIHGRYCGKKPKQAANKAFSSIIKDFKKNGNQTGGVNVDINFSIRECTRNSKHKEYKYIGKRETLANPVKVEIANTDGTIKEIEYKFHNKLQKAPKA